MQILHTVVAVDVFPELNSAVVTDGSVLELLGDLAEVKICPLHFPPDIFGTIGQAADLFDVVLELWLVQQRYELALKVRKWPRTTVVVDLAEVQEMIDISPERREALSRKFARVDFLLVRTDTLIQEDAHPTRVAVLLRLRLDREAFRTLLALEDLRGDMLIFQMSFADAFRAEIQSTQDAIILN